MANATQTQDGGVSTSLSSTQQQPDVGGGGAMGSSVSLGENAQHGTVYARGSGSGSETLVEHPLQSATSDAQPSQPEPNLFDRDELLQMMSEDLSAKFAGEDTTKAWTETAQVVEDYSKGMVEEWYAEIDALPTFAGLFATALTAIVESLKLLQPPQADPTAVALAQAIVRLAGTSADTSLHPHIFDAMSLAQPFRVPAYAVWLNALWFLSLVLSLSSASVGIIVKQWLNGFKSGVLGSSREAARRRQYRLNSLKKWRVSVIVALLPILLQVALVFFLVGLLILLWNIHVTVTGVVSIPVIVLLAFMGATTVFPAIWEDCCYYSPQAYTAFYVWEKTKAVLRPMNRTLHRLRRHLHRARVGTLLLLAEGVASDTSGWSDEPFAPSRWRVGEAATIAEVQKFTKLDGDTLVMAYTTTWDVGRFDTAQACLFDLHDLSTIFRYVSEASDVMIDRWHRDPRKWPMYALQSYRQLINRAIQISLATTPEEKWEETQRWIMDVIRERLIPTPRSAWNARGTAVKVQTAIGGPTAQFYDFVRSLALVSMGSAYDTRSARMAWRDLKAVAMHDTRRPGDVLEEQTVIAALAHQFMQARHHLSDIDQDTRRTNDLLGDYVDTLLLSIRCAARPMKDPASKLPYSTLAYVSDVLSSFSALLSSPNWAALYQQHWQIVRYKDIVLEIARLRDYDHSRVLLTSSLVNALVHGLTIVESEGALSRGDVEQCRKALGTLKDSPNVPAAQTKS